MPIRTPRGGGRWPRDVASTAEPGRAVLGGRASGAGPSPEWMVRHTLTPGDLRDLQVETIKSNVDLEDSSILMNISWILRADASIRLLKATKICVMGKSHFQSYSCIRCNYTQAFQTQTRPSGGKWTFSYIGFPVELNTVYFIGAHNIPNANMNEDGPSMAVNFTSPGCLDHVMKYKKKCIEAGSLWKPNITACKRSANMVEVNFTTSPLGDRYMALIQSTAVIGTSYVSELTPYFHTCGNDCIRQRGTVVQCPQTGVSSPQDHERIKKTSFSTTTLLPSIKVLVVYPSEICFHHTVCYFTEFLQNRCRSEVILEKWQKKKIAEMGPVQWLTTQKQAADKVIFLLSNDSTTCDGNCDKKGGPCENSQDLFHLAFNLFCSDLRSQAHLHKYVVVYFREGDITDSYRALSVCPTYRLTKDATGFCAELLRAKQRVSVGRRPRACRYSCCSL
ncbi:interleukin-17 receptor B isoform X5 [Bubalus kerabau]|uniref:interleukin-17 receptor B isoform X5 n=1 Tax=Bubalus carabanensis TaxID=3119969 RepID=UPI00244EA2BF|nr:interleukin-17 receptor B isoform X5 [Bubalus carabanensis]